MSTSLVPGVEAAPVFEAGEHGLDAVALSVEDGIIAVLNAMLGMAGMQGGMPRSTSAWRKATEL